MHRSKIKFVASEVDFLEPPDLKVLVENVVFHPDAVTPPDRPYCFVYVITIRNDTESNIRIKGRKWVVKNSRGEITAVEGEGVVGQYPDIAPGAEFRYNSFHLLDTHSAVAEGSYIGVDAHGRRVLTRIPRFEMIVPPYAVKP